MTITWAIILGLLLVVGNGFFVGAEFALVSARRTQLELRAANGSAIAQMTLKAMGQLSLVIAAIQLGVTVCSLALGAITEPAFAALLHPPLKALHLPQVWLQPISFGVALLVVMYFHVVFGEMVPKNLALAHPERAALLFGPPMVVFVTVLQPLVWCLNTVARWVLKLVRIEPRDDLNSTYTLEQVEAFVAESRAEGLLDEDEYERLAGALEFNTHTIADIAVPLDQLETVPRGVRAFEVEELCAETGFSRFPVLDQHGLVGYLHVKDVLHPDPQGRARVVEDKWIRRLATVGSTDSLLTALQTLQASGAHIARVVDPLGRITGVAMLEDVIEELIGEIHDAAHIDASEE